MNKYTPLEFMNKCQWEGGSVKDGIEYGLDENHLDDSIPEFKELIKKYAEAWKEFLSKTEEIQDKCCELTEYEF